MNEKRFTFHPPLSEGAQAMFDLLAALSVGQRAVVADMLQVLMYVDQVDARDGADAAQDEAEAIIARLMRGAPRPNGSDSSPAA